MPTRARPPTSDPSARFRRTRDAHASETAEDYAEAIADLIDTRGEARVRDLARLMGVSHVTVSRIISRIASAGLVNAARHQPITLTPSGRRLAERVRRRHEIVVRFLRAIGVPARQSQIDAEGIEHHVGAATLRAMECTTRRLTRPQR